MFTDQLIPVAFSLMTLGVCHYAMPLGQYLKVIDTPDAIGGRKRHDHPTPMVGGLAVVIPVLFAIWITGDGDHAELWKGLCLVGGAMLLVGFIDDRSDLNPSFRLLAALLVLWTAFFYLPSFQLSFLNFSFMGTTLFLEEWSLLFSMLCLIGLQNAANMADGKNGLVLGQFLVWTAFISVYAPPHLIPVLACLFISLGITLVYNLRAKLFLGDAGSYAISVLIGLLAIYVYNQSFTALPADLVALWFLIPVLDCLRLIVGRVLSGRAPFRADRNHFHHLLAAHFRWEIGLSIYLSLVALPGILAIAYPALTLLWAVMAAVIYVLLLVLLSRLLATRQIANI